MVARWFIAMQELHFTVVFVPGTSNVLADALSRLCPNLTEIALPLRTEESELLQTSSSSFAVSALTVIELATDDQLEYIQMCHNAIVGHNGVDRTLTRLFSLQQVWKRTYMLFHVFPNLLQTRQPSKGTVYAVVTDNCIVAHLNVF